MALKDLLLSLHLGRGSSQLPVYATLPTAPSTPATDSQSDFGAAYDVDSMPSPAPPRRLLALSRFLADFTLGFADGLTVPFALTAGLSSLGETETVIYAGMAEICAGSISMGIGGYLSARGDVAARRREGGAPDEVDRAVDEEKTTVASNAEAVDSYLDPLDLPTELLRLVRAHVESSPDTAHRLRARIHDKSDEIAQERDHSPVLSGMSVALGYLLGGLLPLFPYFFVHHVGNGLKWSFLVCVVALFMFGFTKDYLLQNDGGHELHERDDRGTLRWRKCKHSLWEGTQMVALGSIAAAAAVLCVRALEGMKH